MALQTVVSSIWEIQLPKIDRAKKQQKVSLGDHKDRFKIKKIKLFVFHPFTDDLYTCIHQLNENTTAATV